MCTHGKWIHNKYNGHNYYVGCGQCPSCMMDKADKQYSRLRYHIDSGEFFTLFVTLNYSNAFLPYVYLDDVKSDSICKVYRQWSSRLYHGRRIVKKGEHVIDEHAVFSKSDYRKLHNYSIVNQPVNFHSRRPVAGVCLSKDFSNFIKRFQITLKRTYGIDTYGCLSYFKASEYGPTTLRPHFHVLLFFPASFKKYYVHIRRAIASAWPFCSIQQLQRNIEIANRPWRYVSRYSVRPTDLPSILQVRYISPKISHSLSFGCDFPAFSPSSILSHVKRHSAVFSLKTVNEMGFPCNIDVLFPQYIKYRFFPNYKGFSQATTTTVIQLLRCPESIYCLRSIFDYSQEDCQRLIRGVYRRCARLGVSLYDYADLWLRFHHDRFHYLLLMMHESPIEYAYDNLVDILRMPLYRYRTDWFYYLDSLNVNPNDISDPSKFPANILHDVQRTQEYTECLKVRKINDYVDKLTLKFYNYKPKLKNYA